MLKNKNFEFILSVQLITLLSCLVTCFVCGLPFADGIRYFVFQLAGIMIPGFAVYTLIYGFDRDRFSFYAFGGIFGLGVLLVEYLSLALLNVLNYSTIVSVLISMFSVLVLYRRREKWLCRNDQDDSIYDNIYICILIMAVFTICLMTMSFQNSITGYKQGMNYNKDLYFWIGNSISFTKGLPVQEFRQVGFNLYYHYFSSVVIAQSSLISGLNILDLSIYFSHILTDSLIVISVFTLFRKQIENRTLLYVAVVLVLFTQGSTVMYAEHMYFCPFGFDYGMISAFLEIAYLSEMIKTDDFSLKNIFVSAFLIVLCTGFKGPVSIITLMAFGFVSISFLFQRKWKEGFISGFLWLFAFLAVYLICVIDITGKVATSNDLIFSGPLAAFDNNRWTIEILDELLKKYHFPDNGLTRIAALFLYVFRSNRAASVLLFASFVYVIVCLKKKKGLDLFIASLICLGLWGIALTINTYQNGYSQMYFIMTTLPFSILAGSAALDRIDISRNIRAALLILLILISGNDIYRFFALSARTEAAKGIVRIQGLEPAADTGYFMSEECRELSLHLKELTESDARIALDSFSDGKHRFEECIGVFSERFIWNDGQYADDKETQRRRSIVDRVFVGDTDACIQLKEEGVSYLIQTLSAHPDLLEGNFSIIYSSDKYIVYSIQ